MEYIPKNIRQIGGREDRIQVYMEDYVSTYLRKIQRCQEEKGVAGWLTGRWQQEGDLVPNVFISGAMEVTRIDLEAGQISISPEAWNEGYGIMGTYFSGQDLCGLFVCEGSCRRFRRQALFAAVRECFPNQEALLYLLTEEGEEIVYRIMPRGEERLQGYYCYFERNESMQDYMVDRLPDRRVEWEMPQRMRVQEPNPAVRNKEGTLGDASDPAWRFRQKMETQRVGKDRKTGKPVGRGLVALCTLMAVVIIAGGMKLTYGQGTPVQMKDILSRLHIDPGMLAAVSVLPQETGEHYVGRENSGGQGFPLDSINISRDPAKEIVVEEIPGKVYPTEEELIGEAEETVSKEIEESLPEETELQIETQEESREPIETERSPALTEETEESLPVGTGVLYTVQAGDSLYSISRRFYGTEEMVSVIQQMNDLEDADRIKAGQELLLP